MELKSEGKRYNYRYLKKLNEAKLRLDQNDSWKTENFAIDFQLDSEDVTENILKIDRDINLAEQFRENYEKPNLPVLIINDQKNWVAHQKWTLPRLKLKYRNQSFHCGEDATNKPVTLKMKYFIDYMLSNDDDSPFQLCDSNLEKNTKKSKLFDEYNISDYFYEDLLTYIDESRRPTSKYFIMGPKRSGESLSKENYGLHNWTALVTGRRRWCLFPPTTPKHLIQPKTNWKAIDKPIFWFKYMHNRFKFDDWPTEYGMVECIQNPGETIFIPSGWWFISLNLTDTISITHNFCGTTNFAVVWYKLNQESSRTATLWYRRLSQFRPDLCRIADRVNRTQSFDEYIRTTTLSYEEKDEKNEADEIVDSSDSSGSSSEYDESSVASKDGLTGVHEMENEEKQSNYEPDDDENEYQEQTPYQNEDSDSNDEDKSEGDNEGFKYDDEENQKDYLKEKNMVDNEEDLGQFEGDFDETNYPSDKTTFDNVNSTPISPTFPTLKKLSGDK